MNKSVAGITLSIISIVITLGNLGFFLATDWRRSGGNASEGLIILAIGALSALLSIVAILYLVKEKSASGIKTAGVIMSIFGIVAAAGVGFMGIAASGYL